jgi:hypothetical protein
VRTDGDRLTSKVALWASPCKKRWHFQVDKFINEIDVSDVVTNVLISVKTAIRIIHNKLTTLDQNQFARDLNDDRRNSRFPQSSYCKIYKVFHLGFAAWNILLSPQLMVVPHSEITPMYVWWFVEADMIRNVRYSFFDALSIIFRHSI